MTTYRTLTDKSPTVRTDHNLRELEQVQPDRSSRPDPNQSLPTSTSPPLTAELSTQKQEEGRSAADHVTTWLAVLVAVLVVTALVGLALLGDHDGNSPGVVISGTIGITAGVLGLVLGFIKAHRAP